jgi:hypothetical protein
MPDGAVASPAAQRELDSGVGASTDRRPKRPFSREAELLPGWTLAKHLTRTLGIATAIAVLGAWLAVGAAWWMWLLVPLFWLVDNVFEWAMHRFPMHRPMVPRLLYTNHALVHHRAFEGADLEIRSTHELSLVMMPWYTLLFVFAMAAPIAIAAGLVGGTPLAGVFVLSAVSYFLIYELVHTLHHLRQTTLQRSWWGRRRFIARARRHHHHHHRLDRMAAVNFNVTVPFADRLLGTYE